MRNLKMALAAATGLTLALAACDNEREADGGLDNDVAVVDPTNADGTTNADDFDPLSREYTLSDEAQQRRSELDMDQVDREYREIQEGSSESGGTATGNNTNPGSKTTTTSSGSDMASNSQMSSMPARSEMDWSYLDRNSDGKLSVAEYAIWAIPVDPNKPKPNDETKPYLNAEQANRAADSFFYYDQDGDTYLSQSEFNNARRGGDVS